MPKGYVIAHVDVTDPEVYARYTAETPRVAAAFGGRFLVRAGRYEQVEGSGRSRNIVLEFPDFESARRFYRSEEYAAILPFALDGSSRELVLVGGVDEDN